MNKNILVKTIAAAAFFGTLVASAFGQTALQDRVNLYLRDADLLTATRLLSEQTGLQFVVEPGNHNYQKINLSLQGATAEDAIKYVCQAAGGYAERNEDGVFIIRFGVKREALPLASDIDADKIIIRTIQVRQADPREALELIKYGAVLETDRAYRELWEARNYQQPNNFGTPQTNPMLGALSRFRGETAEDMYGEPLTLPGATANQRAGGGGGGAGQPGGGGGPGGGAGQPGGGPGGGGGGASFSGPNPGGGDSFLPPGTTDLSYNPATNELIFRGTAAAYQDLLQILSEIDKAPKQVTVKVEFITTTQSLDRALGIDWNYERAGIFAGVAPGYFAASSDPVFLNYATGNVSIRLRALLQNGNGRVVTAPVVRTLNNQLASITAGQNTVIFATQQVVSAGGTVSSTTVPIPITIQSFLQVRPRINGDNTITMTLAPQIQNITGIRTGPDGSTFPETTFQGVNVAIRVRDGETIALGGLTAKQDTFTEQRIPLLSDLPIIGQLFKRRQTNQISSELIIFVTPKIVDESTAGLGIP